MVPRSPSMAENAPSGASVWPGVVAPADHPSVSIAHALSLAAKSAVNRPSGGLPELQVVSPALHRLLFVQGTHVVIASIDFEKLTLGGPCSSHPTPTIEGPRSLGMPQVWP